MFVSVTIGVPFASAPVARRTASGEKVSVSRYSKSAVAWITRRITGAFCSSSATPRSLISCRMIAMLLRSMSPGSRCSAMVKLLHRFVNCV